LGSARKGYWMATAITEDLIISGGEVRSYDINSDNSLTAALVFTPVSNTQQPSLINNGQMLLSTLQGGNDILVYFATNSFWNAARVENYGTIAVTGSVPNGSTARAFFAPSWTPDILNAGTISAQGASAYTIESWDGTIIITNTATGTIRATGAASAGALFLQNGGTVLNSGNIISSATGSSTAVGVNGAFNIVNSGLIDATDASSGSDSAFAITFYTNNANRIVNSGTIRADVAINENNPYQYFNGAVVVNSGLIEGQIRLTEGPHRLLNSGQINGSVNLGAGGDLYDGALGRLTGTVFGDSGTDLLIGGLGRDTLNGGDGNDVLFGQGGDTLTGGAGADTFLFTGITPGAPAEVITDFQAGVDRIDLRAISPSSISINGGTITAVTAAGNLTIQVTGAVSMADIVTAATPTVMGTADSDALVAGPSGSVLVGGAGADLLVGGAGNDRLEGGAGNAAGLGNAAGDPNLLWGGLGDDTYVMGDGNALIFENTDAGYDTVEIALASQPSSASQFEMPENVERLIGSGGIGNGLDNSMIGSIFGDAIRGMAGADTLKGLAGNDVLTGGAGFDVLTGGLGADIFTDTASGLNGDTIVDFRDVDKIVITDATLANFAFSLNGNTLTYTGGSLTFGSPVTGTIVAKQGTNGVELTIAHLPPWNDFDGSGASDMLIRDINGNWVTNWFGSSTGRLASHYNPDPNAGVGGAGPPVWTQAFAPDWRIAATGDFNGDGRSDFLLRSDAGWVTDWLGNANGTFNNNGVNASLFFTDDWKIVGAGDFNGDQKSDFLLRRTDGWLTNWLGGSNGGFLNNGANAAVFFSVDWKVIGTGDFNGDGRDDFLLRNDAGWATNWLGNGSGGFTNNGANASLFFGPEWKVVGTGDFNGDGFSDILLRNNEGWVTNWLGTANGGFVNNGANASFSIPPDWQIDSIGDYNGDGADDILLRNSSGWLTNWLGTESGNLVNNGANFSAYVAPNWQIQDPFV
jgi:Ca2+-binding RTX toxin-like protein